jgi:uncharacterized Zn-finger protein
MAHNRKSNNYSSFLMKITCPQCSKASEHSAPRVQKNKKLICPFCNALFSKSET